MTKSLKNNRRRSTTRKSAVAIKKSFTKRYNSNAIVLIHSDEHPTTSYPMRYKNQLYDQAPGISSTRMSTRMSTRATNVNTVDTASFVTKPKTCRINKDCGSSGFYCRGARQYIPGECYRIVSHETDKDDE